LYSAQPPKGLNMPKSPLPLRFSPSGPKIGLPPVMATPNLASLIACAIGSASNTTFAAATESVQWDGGSVDLPVDLKTGYRYSIFTQVSVEQTGLTVSHLFNPRWNRRIKSTGLWLVADTTAPIFQSSNVISAPSVPTETNAMVCCVPDFIPTVDYDMIRVPITCLSGVVATAFIRNPNCWVAVLERGGIAP
jgi:hypothetical protein